MNFYDFITPDELADLPEDPRFAFVEFVRMAAPRLRTEVSRWDSDQDSYYLVQEARHGFINVTIAVARQYEIEPFASMDVPTFDPRSNDGYEKFKFDLDHYVTQIAIDNTIRGRRESVALPASSKDRIRSHLHGLRQCVEGSTMDSSKREKLLKQLDGFATELEKRRLNLLSVTYVTLQVMALPGAVWGSVDIVNKLVGTIWSEVGEAKAVEDAQRSLPPTEAPKALAPPRRPDVKPTTARGYGGGRQADLDEEIPF